MPDSLKSVRTRNTMTPQSQQADPRQVPNSGGGYTFTISPMDRAKRFLFLGSEKSYYTAGEKLSKQNADNLIALINSGRSTELVDLVVEVSSEGRAPKQQPGLFALAVASSFGTDAERAYALGKLPAVARTASSLFTYVGYVEQFRGWGRGLRDAIAAWYTARGTDDLAYQVVKYRQREGWTHRDLFRLSHPRFTETPSKALGEFILRGAVLPHVPAIVEGFQKAQAATTSADWALLVSEYRLSWEMLPTEALNERAVWEALLDTKGSLPLGALLRNLPKLTNVGLIGSGLRGSSRTPEIVARLTDAEALKKARIHPIALLTAMKTYASGQGRSQTWTPNTQIIDALDRAFYLAFGAVTPANKRTLIGLDISGSMGGGWYAGYGLQQASILTPREITAAISLVTVATEPQVEVVGFSHNVIPLNIGPKQRLDDVIRGISNLPFGSTDCAAAMNYAIEHNLDVDTFLIMTDNETNSGRTHPHEALKRYRDKTGIPAKLIVLATTATNFSIADPNDAGMLDIPGFDSSAPQIISEFSRGF